MPGRPIARCAYQLSAFVAVRVAGRGRATETQAPPVRRGRGGRQDNLGNRSGQRRAKNRRPRHSLTVADYATTGVRGQGFVLFLFRSLEIAGVAGRARPAASFVYLRGAQAVCFTPRERSAFGRIRQGKAGVARFGKAKWGGSWKRAALCAPASACGPEDVSTCPRAFRQFD